MSAEFLEILSRAEITDAQARTLDSFRDLVCAENQEQNLTTQLIETAFFETHIVDSIELLRLGWLSVGGLNLDLGSGAGVPGIPLAVLSPDHWVLAESEGRKAGFLSRAVEALSISDRVSVFSGRAEKYLARNEAPTIVCKAVGPVSRIWSWLENCSTWNKLVLFKGPAWADEWSSLESKKARKNLRLTAEHIYGVGIENKQRRLILLERE